MHLRHLLHGSIHLIVIVSSLRVQPWCATKLEDEVSSFGNVASSSWAVCGPDCPIETNAWKTDDTLKVIHHHSLDQKEIMIALKLLGIMASSLLLIGLMVTGLGISGYEI